MSVQPQHHEMPSNSNKVRLLSPQFLTPSRYGRVAAGLQQTAFDNFNLGYSLFVRISKLSFPMVAAVLLLLILLWPRLTGETMRFRLGNAPTTKANALQEQIEPLKMLNARYLGTDDGGQPYMIASPEAAQSSENPAIVNLKTPKADITLKTGTWMYLKADSGAYNQADNLMDLNGRVNVYHDAGYQFHTDDVRIDLQKGRIVGDAPVLAAGPTGEIQADKGFIIQESGGKIFLIGKSRVYLRGENKKSNK